jgi:hypothetical protein
VARRRGEFLGLTHIDKDNSVAGREAALQLTNLDPCRRIQNDVATAPLHVAMR